MNYPHNNLNNLVISRRTLSSLLALFIFLLFASFMLGYFLGGKHIAEELQAIPSFSCLNLDTHSKLPFTNNQLLSPSPPSVPSPSPSDDNLPKNPTCYAAELIGFGTKKSAEAFIKSAFNKYSITLELRERTSTQPDGSTITWFQVVTPRYTDMQTLDLLVQQLAKKESLRDISIVTCTSL